MPYPDDPYAIPPPATPAQDAPWLPDWWNYAGPSEQAQPAELQPGMGIPAPMVDQAAPDAIEMPVDYVGTPTIGQPQVPIEAEPMFAGGPPPAGEPIPYPEPVDAISGNVPAIPSYVEPSAVELRSERLTNPQDVPEETIPYGVQLTPGQRAEQFAAMPEEDRLRSQMEWIRQRDAAEAARQSKMDLDDRQRQVENQAIIDRARAEARARAIDLDDRTRKLAEENVDPERWWSSRDTGQKIAGFMAAILGGLVQGRRGGPNSGIEMMDRAIEQDIDAQKANMAHRRAMLQQQGASNEMLAQMAEQDNRIADEKRIANYHYLEKQLATDMAQWDPAGRNAIETGAMIRATRDKRAAAIAAMEDQNFKQMVDAQKAEADIRKANADAAKAEAEAAKLRGGGVSADKVVRPAAYYTAAYGRTPPSDMSEKEFKSWLSSKASVATLEKTEQETANAAAARTAGDLTNTDDTPIKFSTPESATRVARKRAAVDNGTRIINQLLNHIEAEGWSSDTMKSPAWLRAQSDAQSLYIQLKNDAELGVLAGPDMGILEKMSGGDPTQIRDSSAALKQLRHNMVENFNTEIKSSASAGSKPKRYAPARLPHDKPTEKTADDATFQRALNSNAGTLEAFQEDIDAMPRGKRPPGSEDPFGYYGQRNANPMAAAEWVSPGIRAKIDEWAGMARSGNEKALGYLNELSTRGGTPAIRHVAAVALAGVGQATTEAIGPEQSSARETIPEAR